MSITSPSWKVPSFKVKLDDPGLAAALQEEFATAEPIESKRVVATSSLWTLSVPRESGDPRMVTIFPRFETLARADGDTKVRVRPRGLAFKDEEGAFEVSEELEGHLKDVIRIWFKEAMHRDSSLTPVERAKTQKASLEYGRKMTRQSFPSPLSVEEREDRIVIATGALRAVINTQRFNLFDGAWVDANHDGRFGDGEQVVPAGASQGIVLQGLEGRLYRSSLAKPRLVEIEERGPVRAVVRVGGDHQTDNGERPSKTVRETEAEAVAFVVSQAVGLDTNTASSDYIQLYAGSKATLAASLDRIQHAATAIISSILDDRQTDAPQYGRAETPSRCQRCTAAVDFRPAGLPSVLVGYDLLDHALT